MPAVDNVSFEAQPGEVAGYLGPNGSGKSTTMKMITGLISPSDGQIFFQGQSIHGHLLEFKHLMVLGLIGGRLADGSLIGFRKIPFACSYLPGKSKVHIVFAAALALLPIVLVNAAETEQWVVSNHWLYGSTVFVLAVAIVVIRRKFVPETEIQFEE